MITYKDNYLQHYGVLGMKWGVRKEKETSGDNKRTSNKESDESRKETIKKAAIAVAAIAGIGAAAYLAYKFNAMNKISSVGINNAPEAMKTALKETDDILFKEGTVFHRMEAFANIDVTKKSGLTYMSYKPDDVLIYKSLLKDWSGTGQRYDSAYKLLSDIKAPSKEQARQIFDQLWKNDPQYKIELTKTLTATYSKMFQDKGYPKDKAIKMALITVKDKYDDDAFQAGIYSFVRRGYDSEMLTKKLMNKGYQAIEDYFDKGTMAQAPMILLDAENTLIKTGEEFVSKAMQESAMQDLYSRGIIDGFGRLLKK